MIDSGRNILDGTQITLPIRYRFGTVTGVCCALVRSALLHVRHLIPREEERGNFHS